MDQLTLYFDRNFGRRLPGALNKLRTPFDVKWHQGQNWPQDMPDDEWLELVGKKDWIVLTQDQKFHLIDNEIEAVKQHSVKCFYFPGASLGLWETFCIFAKYNSRLTKLASQLQAPFIYEVKANGHFKKIFDTE